MNTLPCTRARVSIPPRGVWTAVVRFATLAELGGPVTLRVGDLTLIGSIARSVIDAGIQSARIVGGSAGWTRTVDRQNERNDAGVLASVLVAKLAAEAGEPVDLAFPDRVVGPAATRFRGLASEALTSIVGPDWYVGMDGITRIGRRPFSVAPPMIGGVSFLGADMGARLVYVASEAVAGFMPGAQLVGYGTIEHVSHHVDEAMKTELVLEAA